MNPHELVTQLRNAPQGIEFSQVMQVINEYYHYQPTQFNNGELTNEAGTNEGSCKIFYFAKALALNKTETLNLFGHYYREDVLAHPAAKDHSNIRTFIKTGWSGIVYNGEALIKK